MLPSSLLFLYFSYFGKYHQKGRGGMPVLPRSGRRHSGVRHALFHARTGGHENVGGSNVALPLTRSPNLKNYPERIFLSQARYPMPHLAVVKSRMPLNLKHLSVFNS